MSGNYESAYKDINLIENVGDAREAIFEMMWLISRNIGHDEAVRLIENELYPMCRGEIKPDDHFLRFM